MAFKLGRKLGKLDAICAKLKQTTNTTESEETGTPADKPDVFKNITNGSPKEVVEEQPADLTVRSHNNNNVVGKADLNSVDENQEENNEVLDFTLRPSGKDNAAGNSDWSNNDRLNGGRLSAQDHIEHRAAAAAATNEGNIENGRETSDTHSATNCANSSNETSSSELKDMVNAMREKRKTKQQQQVMPTTTAAATSRRKSRKAAIPRSITQVRDYYDQIEEKDDELAEYEINNQNTNFPPDDCGDENEKDFSVNMVGGGSGVDSVPREGRLAMSVTANENSNSPKFSQSNNHHSSTTSHVLNYSSSRGSPEHVEYRHKVLGHRQRPAADGNSINSPMSSAAAPLDLSVSNRVSNRSNEDSGSVHEAHEPFSSDEDDEGFDNDRHGYDNEDYDDDFFHPDRNLVIDEQKAVAAAALARQRAGGSVRTGSNDGCKGARNEQANHLKDFAENTMNELISMYGFGGGQHGDLAKHVPMKNYKHILQYSPNSKDRHGSPVGVASHHQGGGASYQGQPISSGDEDSYDCSPPIKGIYANYVKPATVPNAKSHGNNKLQNDRFTTSSSFINAVYNSSGSSAAQMSPGLPNYSKYLKRYNNGSECGGQHCKDLGYREHYHCIDCSFQVFVKKEEMVRHYKWHRKREESLQHGFLRFSPMDNCTKRFGSCTHNGKQTHYHCLQNSCDKVYISTSDVQMHANYHRKDSAIMSEGFQRFRATEDCGSPSCTFYGQRTTHFHCLRSDCKFTFKNKADMEKHKSYHQKDEVLGRDGFKKFMKYEHCMFTGCRYSKVSNHIHCIRGGCDYVLHSTAQLYSHKRKHERRDFENAYKKYRDHTQPPTPTGATHQSAPTPNKPILPRPEYGHHGPGAIHGIPGHNALPVNALGGNNPLAGNHLIQTLVNMPVAAVAMKRPIDFDNDLHSQTEPLELKKPKLEPSGGGSDVDMSAPSTPSACSTPVDKYGIKMEVDEDSLDADDSNHGEDMSKEASPVEKARLGLGSMNDSIDLSSSLTLPIPRFVTKGSEPLPMQHTPSPSGNGHHDNTHHGNSHSKHNKGGQLSMFSALSSEKNLTEKTLSSLQHHIASLGNAMPSTLTGSLVSMNPGMLLTVPSTVAGASTVLQPPKSVYAERREKDDSWKTYLVRYTANDPCNPRCLYLYKDHYHCKMDGCLVLFKSKDGVREHARFHELQDRITPIAYQTYETTDACPEKCQYSEKEKHYHCIWTGCTHVVPYIGPTFGRLEHYRIHEYARAAAGKSYNRSTGKTTSLNQDDSNMRRRGRPPKYPKIDLPKIPKVELSDEEIRQSQMSLAMAENLNTKVINGFRIFSPDDPCPDDRCSYKGKLHYHCARPRCFTITDRIDVLNLHAKDFHSFVKILEGYEFFDRTVSCRRSHCPNNQTNRHFHCTRPKCDYSFIRHSTMSQHEKKHNGGGDLSPDLQLSPNHFHHKMPHISNPDGAISVSQHGDVPHNTPHSGTAAFLPVSSLHKSHNQNVPIFLPQPGSVIMPPQSAITLHDGSSLPMAVAMTTGPGQLPISTVQALPASVSSTQMLTGLTAPMMAVAGMPVGLNAIDASRLGVGGVSGSSNVPLTVLLQQGVNQIPQPSWNELKAKMHYAISQNCGRPFCKLKKKDHYHCFDCNQAFSDPARLRSHIGKHGIKLKRSDNAEIAPKPHTQPPPLTQMRKMNNFAPVAMEMDPDEAQCLADAGNMADSDSEDEDEKSSSLNLNPSTFSEMISKAQEQNKMGSDVDSDREDVGECDNSLKIDTGSLKIDMGRGEDEFSDGSEAHVDFSSRSGRKITKTRHDGFMNSGEINLSKRQNMPPTKSGPKSPTKTVSGGVCSPVHMHGKMAAMSASRGIRDDSVPGGYSRWRYNEECKYPKCAYKHSVTHFHCVRDDCGYGFSDRSRLVQHTLRHERIDSITGGELQQYRINQDCEVPDCENNKKMSHFHCKRCTYSCTDSSKVLTHRKYHAKMDNIVNQGFGKFLAADDCGVSMCQYSRKQNHFHCLVDSCKAAVLGPTQMSAHKQKHDCD